jgi:hypothetical protein
MKSKEVWYERKFNLGNFETETIGLLVVVEDGEKFGDVLAAARKAVLQQGSNIPRPKSAAVKELLGVLDKKAGDSIS